MKLLLKIKTEFPVPALYNYGKISKFFTRLPVKRLKIWINFSKSTTYYFLFETYFSVLKCLCKSPDTIFMKKLRTKVSDRSSKLSSKVIFNNNLKLHRHTENATVWETVTSAGNKSKFLTSHLESEIEGKKQNLSSGFPMALNGQVRYGKFQITKGFTIMNIAMTTSVVL